MPGYYQNGWIPTTKTKRGRPYKCSSCGKERRMYFDVQDGHPLNPDAKCNRCGGQLKPITGVSHAKAVS